MKIVKLAVVLVAMVTLLATAPAAMATGDIDVKPGSCPNSINLKNNGLLPVTIAGNESGGGLNISAINASTVKLQFWGSQGLKNVTNVMYSYEDIITPYPDTGGDCCTEDIAPDGFMDLSVKFSIPELVANGMLPAYKPRDTNGTEQVRIVFEYNDGTPGGTDWHCVRTFEGGSGPAMATANGKLKAK